MKKELKLDIEVTHHIEKDKLILPMMGYHEQETEIMWCDKKIHVAISGGCQSIMFKVDGGKYYSIDIGNVVAEALLKLGVVKEVNDDDV